MNMKKIDNTDVKIIKLLQKNGRMTNTEIAKETGVAEATIRYRMQAFQGEIYSGCRNYRSHEAGQWH